jgi:hypothetical protein
MHTSIDTSRIFPGDFILVDHASKPLRWERVISITVDWESAEQFDVDQIVGSIAKVRWKAQFRYEIASFPGHFVDEERVIESCLI